MSKATDDKNRRVSTLPPVIRRKLDGQDVAIYRVLTDDGERYELVCGDRVLHDFTAWQYHVLNALFSFGGDTYPVLLGNANDRFGTTLTQNDIDALFETLRQKQLFDETEAPKHPLTSAFCGDGKRSAPDQKPGAAPEAAEEAGLWKTKVLFNPSRFLKSIRPALTVGGTLAYALPFLTVAALLILWNHTPQAHQDLFSVLSSFNILFGTLFSLFTVNALSVFITAAVAYAYGGTVNAVSLAWFYEFIPRLTVDPADTEKFTRRQTYWLYAAPLLARIGIFSVSVLLWYHGRPLQGALPQFFATVAFISGLSFLITACPFYKSSGYRLIAEYLGDPQIRDKAFLALLNKWKKNAYARIDSTALAVYALICVLFIVALTVAVLLCLHGFLSVQMGTKSLVVVTALALIIGFRLRTKILEVNDAYKKRQQFERWRQHAVPEDTGDGEKSGKKKKTAPGSARWYVKNLLIVTAVLVLLSPYAYRAGGRVVLMPATQQQISTDLAGIISEVYYEGGEKLTAGTVIARLSVSDAQAQLGIYEGKRAEQQAYIEQLRAAPTDEDITVAEEKLAVAAKELTFSQARCERQRKLYKTSSISLDALEDVEKICEVDQQEVDQANAELTRIMAGIPQEQIETAEAALLPIVAQIKQYTDQIERSTFKMPFDGNLTTLHLKERIGQFLDRGVPLAVAEDDSSFKVILEVPESDSPYIRVGAPVEVRLAAYPGRIFRGEVKTIAPDVEEQTYGRMVKIIATLENDGDALKSGMTGFAKITGDKLMIWQILTQAVHRFLTIEIWAWVP